MKSSGVDMQTSVVGRILKPRLAPTHWVRKFTSKRAKWLWMQENMPEACELALEVKKCFGKIESVTIKSPIKK
jgi:hypothetical protein